MKVLQTSKGTFDVVVVGFGIAGLSAAVTAHQNGSKVAMLERAPSSERGGNTRYTDSLWRMQSEGAVSDDFQDRYQGFCSCSHCSEHGYGWNPQHD